MSQKYMWDNMLNMLDTKNSITELKHTDLYLYLNKIDQEFAKKIELFVHKLSPILSTIKQHFPHYTRHDAHHGYRVTKRISQILKKECLQKGNKIAFIPAEAFLLIAASYAHDLGMTVLPNEKESLLTKLDIAEDDNWKTDTQLQKYLRTNHSERGGTYIDQNWNSLGIPKNLVFPLNDLMRSHNMSVPQLEVEFRAPIAAQEKEICIKQLSVILCIADAIEFSETRVVEGVLEELEKAYGFSEKQSYMENMKHVCIGDSVAVGDDGNIIFSGTFSDADILSLAHNTIDNIEEWIRGYCDIEKTSFLKRLKIEPAISRNLKMIGADFERIGVRINKENIINLISSNSIWSSNPGLSIKELFQNSVEACRYRAYNSPPSYQYTPRIIIKFDRENRAIFISDNGCGMSRHVILNNFLTVGNSRSKDKSYMSNEYESLSRFGVGFWSVFTIAKKVVIKTAPFEFDNSTIKHPTQINGCEFEITIDKVKDYTLFKNISTNSGTSIKLLLKEDIVLDDIIYNFKNSVLCSEIDTQVEIDKKREKLPKKLPEINDSRIFGPRLSLKRSYDIQTFNWSGSTEGMNGIIELKVKFAYRLENSHATFMMDNSNSLLQATDSLFHSYRIGVCGFNIPLQLKNICFDLFRIGTFIANCTSPQGFAYSINRKQLLETEASLNYSSDISHLLHNAYREFLKKTNSYSPLHIYNMNMQSTMHGGNVYDQYTNNELRIAYENYPDLLCFKLYKVDKNTEIKEADVLFVDLTALLKMEGIIWVNQNYYTTIHGNKGLLFGEDALPIAFDSVKSLIDENKDNYVIEANRPASMLFDNDPESTVEFIAIPPDLNLCIQKITIDKITININLNNEDIYDGIRGVWRGTFYIKDFLNPKGNPFIFLGRDRVLIKRNSKLSQTLIKLYKQKHNIKLANIIKLLNEAEQGFISDEIKEYL
jgi:hypothetical protein